MSSDQAGQAARIKVWSLWVRLSHWLLAGIVGFNVFNESGPLHRYAGYVATGTVALRLLYGLMRPQGDHARLRLPGWQALCSHVIDLSRGRVHRELGHNPAGMLMALILWALVLSLGVTGWMSQLDRYWGEEWLTDIHETLAEALQICVLAHLAGVIVMSLLQRESLVKAMLTGRKAAIDRARR